MKAFRRFLIILFFCLQFFLQAFSQFSISDFTKFNYEEGLTDNNITSIVQDDFGYIWIGTVYGLNRYDGKTFKQFYRDDENIDLPGNHISYLKNLGDNEIGICTRQGLEILNTRTFKHQLYLVADTGSFAINQNDTWDVCKMPNDKIAITSTTGFYVFNKDGSIFFRYDHFKKDDVGKQKLLYGREIFRLSDYLYIVFTQNNSYAYFNLKTKQYKQVEGSSADPFPFFNGRNISRNQISDHEFLILQYTTDTIVYYNHWLKKTVYSKLPFDVYQNISWYANIKKYNDSTFLLNGKGGFYKLKLDRKTGIVSAENLPILKDINAFCYFKDKEGRLWFGTNSALYMERKSKPTITPVEIIHKIKQNYVGGIKLYKNKLYVGNCSKGENCLWILDNQGKKIEKKILFYEPLSEWNEIISINQFYDDTLWIGTNAGILWFSTLTHKYGKVSLFNDDQERVKGNGPVLRNADNKGNVFIIYQGSSLFGSYNIYTRKFDLLDNKTNPAVSISNLKHLTTDNYDNVWLAGDGLTSYNTKQHKFDTSIYIFAGANKYSRNVLALSADNSGSLWIQTADNDFLEYRIAEKKFIAYNEATGFPVGRIEALSEVYNNKMWIQQRYRLLLFDTKTKNYQIFAVKDGMPADKTLQKAITFDKKSQNYFALYQNHVGIINYSESTVKDSPSLIIDELIINNKKHIFHPDSLIITSYKDNDIILDFSVIDFEYGSDYIYHYRINKGDWVFLNTQTQLRLGELSNGNHKVSLKTTDKSGNQLLKNITIVIKPPFWKTNWFIVFLFMLAIAVLYFIYRNRIKKIKAQAELKNKIARSEMKALHAQMNPHFIFNSLNSIKDLILHRKNNEASRYLSKFAHLIRLNLQHSKEPIATMQETIEYLDYYLEMEQLRFNDLHFAINVSKEINTNEILLPSMIFQPIVENAIWHGLLPLKTEKKVTVNFFKKDDQLYCTIEDNGVGFKADTNYQKTMDYQSIGLENVRQRLQIISDQQSKPFKIVIEDKQEKNSLIGKGTIVTVNLPLNLNPYD